MQRPWHKILASFFIVFHLIVCARVFIPFRVPLVDQYINFFSIYQEWSMFAPNPTRFNVFVEAHFELKDGQMVRWAFPRRRDMSTFEMYVSGKKYRKLLAEGIQDQRNAVLWKDIAKFALRNFARKEEVAKVYLVSFKDEVPDLKRRFIPHGELPKNYMPETFYSYEVGQ